MRTWIAVAAAATLLAACQGEKGPAGDAGAPGAGYLPLEPAGVVGFVKDTAGEPVIGAKVYLVPNTDIPTAAIDLSTIGNARASTVDEPLEDTIAANGAGYAQATTDANGIYRIATVPAGGRFYLTVVPAQADAAHLPGGSLCRASLQDTALVGKQLDVRVSTKPSPAAEFVGPSVCLGCHGVVHEMQTLHMNGIRPVGQTGPLQKGDRFPVWNDALAKFVAGTTLYYYDYDAAKKDWKLSETNPGANVSFTAFLFLDVDSKYKVTLTDVKGTSAPKTYTVELSYGGGLYKQRWAVKLADGSRYILPIQYNFQAAAGLAGDQALNDPFGRWTWTQYNSGNWYVEDTVTPASSHLREPAPEKSFDNACAGCHFTGYKLVGNKASAVPDEAGEYDYDGDGVPENMNISCETCHGPGSEHWYRAGNGRSIVSPSLLTPERAVTICAQCHTRAIGNGGLQAGSPAAYVTEAPLNVSGRMMIAGTSRVDFLTNHVSKIDDGYWTVASGGDTIHSVKHHQQATDFIKSLKYRNPFELLTCNTCHDVHGNSGLPHQLQSVLDASTSNYAAAGTEGLCLGCHKPFLNGVPAPVGLTVGQRMQQHWAAQGVADVNMGNIGCVSCHMPKTAKSGSGLKQALILGVQYWSGDISSHRFDVPRGAELRAAGLVGTIQMPIPYTNDCGYCHSVAP